MKHHKLSLKIRRPRLQQGERVRGGITSSKGQEVITSSKGKKQKTRKKKHEARSNYRQQAARSKKQEARKQQAAGRQVRELVFLSIQKATLGTAGGGPQALSVPQGPAVRCGERALCEPWRLEDRSWRPWPAGPVRPSGPCCFGVAIAPCVNCGGWKTGQIASFLVSSESNVRHCGRWPAGPVRPSGPCIGVASASCVSRGGVSRGGWKTGPMAAVARRPGPSLRTLLFWRGNRAVCELWRLEDRSGSLLSCRFRKQR